MKINQLITCPGGYRAVYACENCGDFHTKPVASLALVEFEPGTQDIAGCVVADHFGFAPAPSIPGFIGMLSPGETLEETEEMFMDRLDEAMDEPEESVDELVSEFKVHLRERLRGERAAGRLDASDADIEEQVREFEESVEEERRVGEFDD